MKKLKNVGRKIFYWDVYKHIAGIEEIHDINIFGFNFIIKIIE